MNRKQLILDLWAAQFTATQIAEALGVTRRWVKAVLAEFGVTTRRFRTTADALDWLAKDSPRLASECTTSRNGTSHHADERQAA